MDAGKSRHQVGGQGFLTEAISTKTVSTASYRNRGQMSIPNYSCVEEKPQHTVDRGMSLEERRHRDEQLQ